MGKSKYDEWLTDDGLMLIRAWARDGLTYEQISHNMGIRRSTLNEWIKKFKDIADALKRTREMVDVEVENAMYQHAIGHCMVVKKCFKMRHVRFDEKGHKVEEWETLEQGDETVYIPPDTTAGIYWLKNRKPKEWRDKRDAPPQEIQEAVGDDGFEKALEAAAQEVFGDVDAPADLDS